MASSLVGEMTITPVPFRGMNLAAYKSSMAGIKNAKVFPDPVRAAPKTSRPAIRGGIARAWTYRNRRKCDCSKSK